MIALLFTDMEGSTQFAAQTPSLYAEILARHFEILRSYLAKHQGVEFQENGDGLLLAFQSAGNAAAYSIDVQTALRKERWSGSVQSVKIRMALHVGEAEFRDGQYRGIAMNLTSRLLAAAHGEQILCSESAARLLEAPLRVMGAFRLRGFQREEKISELLWRDGLPQRHLRVEHARSHNLSPIQVPIVGREHETATLKEWLDPDHRGCRIVTLLGSGGIGKTRLAAEVAWELLDAFNHSITWVSLADINDPNYIFGAIRRALKVSVQPSLTALQQLKEALGGNSILLVLDNLEQLLPQAVAPIQTLLREIPGIRCLVTSRIALNLPGERVFQMTPLATPDHTNGLGLNAPACKLFVQCAQSSRPDFQITDANRSALLELSNLLEGVPLSIKLAAARTSVLTLNQISAQIQDGFTLLRKRHTSVSHRHDSLDAALHWSYHALPMQAKKTLAALSVFIGGFSLEAATHVAGEGAMAETQATLQILQICSFLSIEENGSELRFSLLESIRRYAADHLGDAADAIKDRHWRYFSTMAYAIEARMKEDIDAVWLEQFEVEHSNFREALKNAFDPIRRLRLATALHQFWLLRGEARENRLWFSRPPDDCTDPRELDVVVRAYHAAATLDLALMRLWRARIFFKKSYFLFNTMGEEVSAAVALHNLGMIAFREDNYGAAKHYYLQCIEIFERLRLIPQLGAALTMLGILYLELGDTNAARPILIRSSTMLKNTKDRASYAISLQHCGYLELKEGNLRESRKFLLRSLSIYRELQMVLNMPTLYFLLARLAKAFGQVEMLGKLLIAAEVINRRTGQKLSKALEEEALALKSFVHSALGDENFNSLRGDIELLEIKEVAGISVEFY